MLTINPAQYDALSARFDGDFAHRMRLFFEDVDAKALAGIDDDQWLRRIRDLAKSAAGFGLKSEMQTAQYIVAAWAFGPGFDQRLPWVSRLLNARAQTADQRAKRLRELVDAALVDARPGIPVGLKE
jgi:hypothetical protein